MSEFRGRLEQTRRKLLDLTKRNKLINYKRPSKTRNLKIIDESPEFIYQHLVFEEESFRFESIPEPKFDSEYFDLKEKIESLEASISLSFDDTIKKELTEELEQCKNKLKSIEEEVLVPVEVQAKRLGFPTSNQMPEISLENMSNTEHKYIDDVLQTLHYPKELEKILKKIELSARSIIEESGTNMLYLILGVLEWTESKNSDVKIKSPLVSIPVSLKRGKLNKETSTYEYILEYNGDLIDTNKSLSEKLKNDFSIELPEITEESSFNNYIKEVQKICKNRDNWIIKQEVSLDFLQFGKILMYNDLDTNNWDDELLENNQVLQDIFLGKETSGISYTPEEYDIDKDSIANDISLVMDADSSQHSAIVDVMNGKNVVIEGPPGTGKSQTISNMVAALISDGKSVLFVSEKLAALEVVYQRLSDVGLGDFCLELHSHKTQKLKVLENIKKRVEGDYKIPSQLKVVKHQIGYKKDELRAYLDVLHTEYGKSKKKIFEIFWLVEKYRDSSQYLKFDIDEVELYDIWDVNKRVEELKKYQAYLNDYNFKVSYWNGFDIEGLEFIDIDMFLEKLNSLSSIYKTISSSYESIEQLANSTNIIYDVDDELRESKNINLFFDKSEKYLTDYINQPLLNVLDCDNINIFKEYITIREKYLDVKSRCQDSIVNIDILSSIDIKALVHLDNKILKDIDNKYLKNRKKYEKIYLELDNYMDVSYLKNSDLVNKLSHIEDFLYQTINIFTIENIYGLNKEFIKSLSKFEKILKELMREIGIFHISDIYDIKTIIQGLKLITKIDRNLYINCVKDIGTSRFISEIERAKTKEDKILKLIKENEQYFDIDKINLKSIEELKAIRVILIDKKDSFFKIFSGQFKQARTEYSKLLKESLSKCSNEWIEHLDSAIEYLTLKEAYEKDKQFKTTFKELFNGLNTNWSNIYRLNEWAEEVRKNIKVNEYITILLSGEEQVHISLSSYLVDFEENIETFNIYIEKTERTYSNFFIKNLYDDIGDIVLIDLKHKLKEINVKIDNYLPSVEFIFNKEIDINKIVELINNYKRIKDLCIVELEKINSIGVESFTDNTLSFMNSQDISIVDVVNMIQSELNLTHKLNSLIKQIELNSKYKLQQTEEEIKLIKYHIVFIESIQSSHLSNVIQELLIKQYYLIIEILKNISKEQSNSIEVSHEIVKYGKFQSVFFGSELNYNILIQKLDKANDNKDNLSIWIDYQKLLLKLKELGLLNIVDSIESEVLPKELIIEIYYYNYYNSLLKSAFRNNNLLNSFNRLSHEEAIKKFKELDKELLILNREYIAAKASNRDMPMSQSAGSVKTFTNMKLLKHEISKKKRHIPIRQLIKRAGEAIQALKPCFMMSPLSVAQYLPPSLLHFDVLLIDEASQLRPEEALGVIARASQVVIVGDPKQLPPTSFFDAIKDDSDEDENTVVDESESILDSCIDLYNPVRRLKWHYRSQHESLIDFSNKQFYDNDLIVFPSPTSISSEELGVKHTYIEKGIYHSGTSGRYNKEEARIVVEHIEKKMKNFSEKSLGVGTFNMTQRDLIQQMIDEKEKINPDVANYIAKWKETSEPFFIKNLESLQGDERDAIFISTTFGKDKETGKVMQRFGPINLDDGWRRLNVLVTRAKQKMHIFTSLESTDIIISETSSKGKIAFKSFLKYLETKQLMDTPMVTDKGFDSPFEESVYQLLSDIGVKAIPQVGVSGYFIDLAVRANESDDYILAIECDGATYHSSKSARDRDRLKEEVLTRLGWKVYRIWSVDWYKNRDNEVAKLIKVIKGEQLKYTEKCQSRILKNITLGELNTQSNNILDVEKM